MKSNLFNLDDKTRIRLLKGTLLVLSCSYITNFVFMYLTVRLHEKNTGEWKKLALTNNKIIRRFAEISPDDVLLQIKQEFEFDEIISKMNDER